MNMKKEKLSSSYCVTREDWNLPFLGSSNSFKVTSSWLQNIA